MFANRSYQNINFTDRPFAADNAPKAPAPTSTESVATSWELALVTAPSSNGNAVTSSKLVHKFR
jgi:hypothetical protein